MALAQVYSAVAGDTITAARWNNEFGNIYTNGTDVAFPVTKAVSFAGFTVTMDAAAVTTIVSSATQGFNLTPGNKSGAPGLNGSFLNLVASTFTDTDTAASGTATQFSGTTFRAPTLAATNSLVTTTDAATVTIEAGPTAGANETLTNAWALRVVAGKTRLGGDVSIGGDTTFAGTLSLSSKSLWLAEGAAVASDAGGTTNIWTTDGNTIHVTGTNTITSLGTAPQAGAYKMVIFDGALTLTHGANLLLPGSANITTSANDWMLVYADTTTQLDVVAYTRADGRAIVANTAAQGSSMVLIETLTPTAVASAVFDDLGSEYDEHIFQLIKVRPATDATSLEFAPSGDNGSNYANTGYQNSRYGTFIGTQNQCTLANGVSNLVGRGGINGTVRLFYPHDTSVTKQIQYQVTYAVSGDTTEEQFGSSRFLDTSPDVVTAAINAIKFSFASGNIATGTIRHYGIKNS